jgi:hypothetical protein
MNIRKPSTPLALALAAGLLASLGMAGCADNSNGVGGTTSGQTTSGSTTGGTTSGSTTGSCTGPDSCNGNTIIGCPSGTTFHTLLASNGYVGVQGVKGPLCLVCSVTNPENVVADNVSNDPAQLNSSVSLLTDNGIGLDVYHGTAAAADPNPPQFPAGTLTGFIVSDPKSVLNVALLQALSVTTTLTVNGTTTTEDTAGNNKTLALDLLTLLGDPTKIGVAVETTKPFSGLVLTLGGVANVLSTADAWAAGVCE